MNPDERANPENDATSRPAHPAPAQSPRPLGRDGLPQRQSPDVESERAKESRDEPSRE